MPRQPLTITVIGKPNVFTTPTTRLAFDDSDLADLANAVDNYTDEALDQLLDTVLGQIVHRLPDRKHAVELMRQKAGDLIARRLRDSYVEEIVEG